MFLDTIKNKNEGSGDNDYTDKLYGATDIAKLGELPIILLSVVVYLSAYLKE